MKNKKIRYVSLESSAFLLDLDFQTMTCEERGAYCSIIFNLYENGGYLLMDKVLRGNLCNCTNFEKVFEKIKHKFLIKDGKISHKRVLRELKRAKKISQLQRENGLRGMESRWGGDNKAITKLSQSNNKDITKRSEEKRSEDKRREEKRSEETIAVNADGKEKVRLTVSQLAAKLASQSVSSPPSADSPRLASQPTVSLSFLRKQESSGRDLTLMMFNFHDELCRIFPKRTPSDSSSIRNLANWVRDRIRLGQFQDKIIGNVLLIARDSKKGKSRKPIAVFYARLKKELNYGSDR
jgi:uncharacterized protein YdaU (DUF1376 family)